MYFLNLSKLKAEIREGKLAEAESFRYLLATFLVLYLTSIPSPQGSESLIVYLLLCLINLWGLRRAYLANGGGNGSSFLVRFFAMGWVIGLRGLVVLIPVYLLMSVLLSILLPGSGLRGLTEASLVYEYSWYGCFIIYTIWYYLALSFHLRGLRVSV